MLFIAGWKPIQIALLRVQVALNKVRDEAQVTAALAGTTCPPCLALAFFIYNIGTYQLYTRM